MRRRPCLLFSLLGLTCILLGQQAPRTPRIEPANVQAFDIDAGLPISCTYNGFVDRSGRLWVNPCFGQSEHKAYSFYLFDGRQAYPVRMTIPPEHSGQAVLACVTDDQVLYGFIRETDAYFFYDPETETSTLFTLGIDSVMILFMGIDTHGHMVLYGTTETTDYVFFHKDGQVRHILTQPRKTRYELIREWAHGTPCVLDGNELWFLERPYHYTGEPGGVLTRVHTETGDVQHYQLDETAVVPLKADLFIDMHIAGDTLYRLDHTGQLYAMHTENGMERKTQLYPLNTEVANRSTFVCEDDYGNLLFIRTQDQRPDALLRDRQGNLHDYSPVVRTALLKSRYTTGSILGVYARDFFQEVMIFTEGGIVVADMSQKGAVQTCLTGVPTRRMVETGRDTIVVAIEPVGFTQVTADDGWHHRELRIGCPRNASLPILDLVPDMQGHLWYPMDRDLAEIAPDGSCRMHHTGVLTERCMFLNDTTMLLAGDGNLFYYYPRSGKITECFADGRVQPGRPVSQICLAADSAVWIATYRGLWHANLSSGACRRYGEADGLRDEKIMCIEKDDAGRIWVGTFSAGLHILEPATGVMQVVDVSNGLSNNTVAGILTDAEGVKWLSTFSGITLVSPDGIVLSRIFAEDGLSTNEFNRFSFCRDSRGRLVFGSINGINILDPESIKERLLARDTLQIYFTSIIAHDRANNREAEQRTAYPRDGVLKLPAAHRYLKLRFALSSYIRPEDQQFSYRIMGIPGQRSEWVSMGSNSELNLYGLPAGKYAVHIRGTDYRGSHSPQHLILRVNAGELFYKETWFMLLVIFCISGIGAIWFFRERLERRKLEGIVVQRTKKILEDKETIEQQANRLRDLDLAKTRLFTNISHEFRTPLTVIQGMADHLASDPRAPELIKRNTKSLLDLVNQMLDLGKLESGAVALDLRAGDLIRFVRYIADSYRSLAETRDIAFHVTTHADTLPMAFDPEKVRQILVNLLSNAIKFTEAGSVTLEVRIVETAGEEQVQLIVSDTGRGIPQDQIAHIFRKYYQVDGVPGSAGGGTGVGLTLAAELVRLMRGRITAESVEGEGSTFIVELPVVPVTEARGPMIDPGRMPVEVEGNRITANHLSGETQAQAHVLVVEDNPDVVHFLQMTLSGVFRVTIAVNGEEGIHKAFEEVPDMIVSDVMMPRKDGFELCETLKHDVRTSHIPIVLLTAKADNASRIAGLRRGADVYLAKPFEGDVLIAQLESLLATRAQLQKRYLSPTPQSEAQDPDMRIEDAFMTQLRAYIEAHIDDENLQVPAICTAMSMSRANLHRKISALTGKPVTAFIRAVRLQRSKQLLSDPNLNIAQIAFAVGFGYAESFSRAFHEEFGVSPSEFRSQLQSAQRSSINL